MSSDQLFPQRFLLSGLREAKGTRIDTRIERKKLSEVLCQRIGGIDDIQPITNDSKNEIGALGSCGRLRNEGVTRMARHQRAYTRCPVPKTGMMGADVTDVNQCVEPRTKKVSLTPKAAATSRFARPGFRFW